MCKKFLHLTCSPQPGPLSTQVHAGKAEEFNKPQLSRTHIHYLKGSLGLFCKRLSGQKEKESLV